MENSEKDTSNQPSPVTVQGKAALEKELKRLLSEERPRIIAAIDEARAHGDLKENAEYHAAKEEQALIEGRINHVQSVVQAATVIDPSSLDLEHVAFGATVEIVDIDTDKKVKYQIVGIDEADISQGKISLNSPIARALIGKHEGDEVTVNTPKGKVIYEICSFEYR